MQRRSCYIYIYRDIRSATINILFPDRVSMRTNICIMYEEMYHALRIFVTFFPISSLYRFMNARMRVIIMKKMERVNNKDTYLQ